MAFMRKPNHHKNNDQVPSQKECERVYREAPNMEKCEACTTRQEMYDHDLAALMEMAKTAPQSTIGKVDKDDISRGNIVTPLTFVPMGNYVNQTLGSDPVELHAAISKTFADNKDVFLQNADTRHFVYGLNSRMNLNLEMIVNNLIKTTCLNSFYGWLQFMRTNVITFADQRIFDFQGEVTKLFEDMRISIPIGNYLRTYADILVDPKFQQPENARAAAEWRFQQIYAFTEIIYTTMCSGMEKAINDVLFARYLDPRTAEFLKGMREAFPALQDIYMNNKNSFVPVAAIHIKTLYLDYLRSFTMANIVPNLDYMLTDIANSGYYIYDQVYDEAHKIGRAEKDLRFIDENAILEDDEF